MRQFSQQARRLAITSVVGLTAGGGFSLWGPVAGIAIGVAIDARQLVLAQEKLGPSKFGQSTKENREKFRKTYFSDAKKWFKESLKASREACDANDEDARTAALKRVADASLQLEAVFNTIITNLDDLTEEERSAIASYHHAGDLVGDQFPDTPAAEKEAAQKKYADAYKHFLDVTKKRRRELLDKLESGEEISLVTPECPHFAVASPGPFFKVSGELGGGWARNGVEDVGVFNGSGFVGGLSAELDFAFNSGTYLGFGVSVLGSGISATGSDPVTSNIRLLVPVDVIYGGTFRPSGSPWPLSVYGFAGPAEAGVGVISSPFSASQQMSGWSAGIGAELQLSPNWSVGLKYRHFDLGSTFFSVFPGASSLVSERGDMVSGTLSYRFPLSR